MIRTTQKRVTRTLVRSTQNNSIKCLGTQQQQFSSSSRVDSADEDLIGDWYVDTAHINPENLQKDGKLFDKVLIANRGEIACRVIATCRRLGIKTVAVHSDADEKSMHVAMADEAVCVGPAASTDSYLRSDRILDAVKLTGAQAVHPGYGFLSENASFSDMLEKAGVEFIGPKRRAIEAMGDKIESKAIAEEAGVNIIPGRLDVIKDDEQLKQICNEIGYPVMIKASAGGGGKGMRVAYNDDEAEEGFRLSTEEARNSFGDDRIFIEKFVEEPRHIEIQLVADRHGQVVSLPERECSIQRRNQKVIEEAPSVLLDPATRKAMQEQAAMLARAVDYESAGTVEFLVDKNKDFYFLEMNTRLQVEHPVTELISGVDLVEQMIRVAAGRKLPENLVNFDFSTPQPVDTFELDPEKGFYSYGNEPRFNGWAIESRVYAEDPFRNFLPSTGLLDKYASPCIGDENNNGLYDEDGKPSKGAGIRCDSGIREGSNISMFYDPMISKLCTYAATREESIEEMKYALDTYVIHGVQHNGAFCRDVLDNPRFEQGTLTTNFIAEEYPDGFSRPLLDEDEAVRVASCVAHLVAAQESSEFEPNAELAKINPLAAKRFDVSSGETFYITVDGVDKAEDEDTKFKNQTVFDVTRVGTGSADDVNTLPEDPDLLLQAALGQLEAAHTSENHAFGNVFSLSDGSGAQWDVKVTPRSTAASATGVRSGTVLDLSFTDLSATRTYDVEEDENSSEFDVEDFEEDDLEDDEEDLEEEDISYSEDTVVQILERLPEGYKVQYKGGAYDVYVRDARGQAMSQYMLPKEVVDMSKYLVSPMPGSLISVAVTKGDSVEEGQELAVVEAMKMQNVLRAEKRGIVKSVAVSAGETLAVDQIILEFESEEED